MSSFQKATAQRLRVISPSFNASSNPHDTAVEANRTFLFLEDFTLSLNDSSRPRPNWKAFVAAFVIKEDLKEAQRTRHQALDRSEFSVASLEGFITKIHPTMPLTFARDLLLTAGTRTFSPTHLSYRLCNSHTDDGILAYAAEEQWLPLPLPPQHPFAGLRMGTGLMYTLLV
ncbi:hypothetical protein NliqN6_6732 [Naganishia liquefaciens]|uniref:Uncharacterized protein n=1 Tax=Naganishia liquefaciens TaxID=104408 RepID=A0A8H3U0L1_9TREE|nr:hypothetical protein NliqN6_6732 [Naganishia liquefaciens]